MNDLIFSCTDGLPQAEMPTCATDYGERVVQIVFAKTAVSCTGNVPLASDFNAVYDTLTEFKYITNGHRVFQGETEIEWHNTEWHDKEYRVEGRIKRINADIARAAEKLNRYHNIYFYFFTDKNYCFGPYYAQPNFNLIQIEGKGQPPYIDFHVDYVGHGVDYSAYDSLYGSLHDSGAEGSITFDRTDTTFDSTVITWDAT